MNRLHLAAVVLASVTLMSPLAAASAVLDEVNPAENSDIDLRKAGDIAIADGPDGGFLGSLMDVDYSIDPTLGSEVGLNPNAVYTYGDPRNPVDRPAFVLTNTGDEEHDLIVDYHARETPSAVDHVRFLLFDGSGRRVGVVSDRSLPAVVPNVGGGDSVYVVVVIDTDGMPPGTDLSGRFTVSVIAE